MLLTREEARSEMEQNQHSFEQARKKPLTQLELTTSDALSLILSSGTRFTHSDK
jgi:hypothetical protein